MFGQVPRIMASRRGSVFSLTDCQSPAWLGASRQRSSANEASPPATPRAPTARGLTPGHARCTYGTGSFFLQHIADRPIRSRHRLLCTIAATLDARPQYALEGSVFIAGAAVQWLRDGLKLFDSAAAVEQMAK